MSRQRNTGNRTTEAASELKAICEQLAVLKKRLRDRPTAEARAELWAGIEKLTNVVASFTNGNPPPRLDPWPSDINAAASDASWGSDPEEVRGG